MIERQVIVTWYSPDEKTPDEGIRIPLTISGKTRNIRFDHALVMGEWYEDDGWCVEPFDFGLKGSELTIHAWADLEPYGG